MCKRSVAAGLIAAVAIAATAQAAQVTTVGTTTIKRPQIVSLGCLVGHGNAAQTIYITNTTNGTIAVGAIIDCVLGSTKRTKVLDAALVKEKRFTDLDPPGNVGSCTASHANA